MGKAHYAELLRQEGVEAVVIATPDALHLAPAVAAAQARKHVMVEKPMATTTSDGQQIMDACQAAGVILLVGHILRFDPHYGEAWRAVRNDKIGEVVHVTAHRNTSTGDAERLGGRGSIVFYWDRTAWTLSNGSLVRPSSRSHLPACVNS